MPRARERPQRSRSAGANAARFRRRVYAVVRRIPWGRVATYGEVAEAAGRPRAARAVGRALAELSPPLARVVPWHRVVNSRGSISRRDPESMALQRELLELEGVRFRGGRVDLGRRGRRAPRRRFNPDRGAAPRGRAARGGGSATR